jgi:hypothetical protein
MAYTIILKFLGSLPRMLITISPENILFVMHVWMNLDTVPVEEI